MFAELFLIAVGTLASEDLTLAATGVLVAQGKLGFWQGVAACIAGIFTGDMLIYLAGRTAGMGTRHSARFARFAPASAIERGARWLDERGYAAVFLSRFTPGLRLPTYFAAGLLPTRMGRFAGYFLLAATVWTPLMIGLTAWLGESVLRNYSALAAFAAVFASVAAGHALLRFSARRRLTGFLKRKVRWEFWPAWAIYLPLVPYLLYLAVRHRSVTLFTAANPGILTGGFVGESKSEILAELRGEPDLLAPFEPIPWTLGPARRLQRALAFAEQHGFPVVLKPDVGERGMGVAIARNTQEIAAYFATAGGNLIVQECVPGLEFGIFYYRYPGEPRGRISSLAEKRFPIVTGDGRRTVRELILADDRAVCQAAAYFRFTPLDLDSVPAAGQRLQLVEIGSHCRGAIFLNGAHLISPALEEAVERVSRAHAGFHFGRYDVRAASAEDLRAGRFRVIELNGVSAEAAHIYDPAVSLWEAYRVMAHHWRIAFEIGAANRRGGFAPMSVPRLAELIGRGRYGSSAARSAVDGRRFGAAAS